MNAKRFEAEARAGCSMPQCTRLPVSGIDTLVERVIEEEQTAETKFVGRIDHFDAFTSGLLPHHTPALALIAREIYASFSRGQPLRCVQLIGHAATWRDLDYEHYYEIGLDRAQAAATTLARQLLDYDLSSRTLPESDFWQGDRMRPCHRSELGDVTLYVGTRGDRDPIVANDTQANRARNRRVDVWGYPAVEARPRRRRSYAGACFIDCAPEGELSRSPVGRLWSLSWRASAAAERRFAQLAAMREPERASAWNAGREKIWFGSYRRGRRTPFAFVLRTIETIRSVLRGRTTSRYTQPCRNRMNHLTIECFDCTGREPSTEDCAILDNPDEVGRFRCPRDLSFDDCLEVDWTRRPGNRWCDAEPACRIRTECRLRDLLHICCNEKETLGFSYFCNEKHPLHPTRRRPMPPPHKIALGPGWFRRPSGVSNAEWREARRLTIVHEAAHLAGAVRLFPELYGDRGVRRLARVNAWAARLNADNYAYYIMEFAP